MEIKCVDTIYTGHSRPTEAYFTHRYVAFMGKAFKSYNRYPRYMMHKLGPM